MGTHTGLMIALWEHILDQHHIWLRITLWGNGGNTGPTPRINYWGGNRDNTAPTGLRMAL